MSARREFLICLSLANLCFLGAWQKLGKISHADILYYRKAPPDWELTAALALVVMAVAWAGLLAGRLLLRIGSPGALHVRRFLFLAGCIAAAEGVRAYPLVQKSIAGKFLLAGEIAVLLSAVFWSRIPARAAMAAVFVLWPLYFLLIGHQLAAILRAENFTDRRHAGPLRKPSTNPVRAVWLIFDEFDQRLAFDRRPARLRLANLDRLRQTSIWGRATTPGPETITSIPGLLLGRQVLKAHESGSDNLILTLPGGAGMSAWGGAPNLFTRARAKGLRTGVVGWYHPYCRVLGEAADFCHWEEYLGREAAAWDFPFRSLSLLQKTWSVAARQVSMYPAVSGALSAPLPGSLEHHRRIATELFQRIRETALEALANPDLDVVFVHWPIPHPPGVLRESLETADPGYLDNLELTDWTVGEVRETLEARGMWERTLLMVTSDHSLRPELWNSSGFLTEEDMAAAGEQQDALVPFLLKMPGQDRGVALTGNVDLSIAADFTIEVLAGGLRENGEAIQYIEHASRTLSGVPAERERDAGH